MAHGWLIFLQKGSAICTLLLLKAHIMGRPSQRSRRSLLLFVGGIAHAQDQQQHKQCPCVRATPWDSLSNNDRTAARTLGYDAETWDMLDFASARVESQRWTSLSAKQQNAAQRLGYVDATTWDCCINHYYAYSYDELQLTLPEAHAAVVTLGYTKQYWNGPEWRYDPPRVEAKTWCDQVTSDEEDICVNAAEIDALRTLCYSPSRYRAEPLSGRAIIGGDGGTQYVGYDHC